MSDDPHPITQADQYVDPDGNLKVPITDVPDELRPAVISAMTSRRGHPGPDESRAPDA